MSRHTMPSDVESVSLPIGFAGTAGDLSNLPFVRATTIGERAETHRAFLWWGGMLVTGQYSNDEDEGRRAARAYLEYEKDGHHMGMRHLPMIISDMPRDLGPMEIGFLWEIATAAISSGAGAQLSTVPKKAPPQDEAGPTFESCLPTLDLAGLRANHLVNLIEFLPKLSETCRLVTDDNPQRPFCTVRGNQMYDLTAIGRTIESIATWAIHQRNLARRALENTPPADAVEFEVRAIELLSEAIDSADWKAIAGLANKFAAEEEAVSK